MSLRAPKSSPPKVCGGKVPCAVPADACAAGWEVCLSNPAAVRLTLTMAVGAWLKQAHGRLRLQTSAAMHELPARAALPGCRHTQLNPRHAVTHGALRVA